MTPFRLVLPLVGTPEIEVDGKRVSNARSVAVKAEVGEATKVYVELVGEGTIEGEGIVHVVRDGVDTRDTLTDWLAQIDPAELETAALARMGGLGGGTTGEAVLDVLRGWAGGGA